MILSRRRGRLTDGARRGPRGELAGGYITKDYFLVAPILMAVAHLSAPLSGHKRFFQVFHKLNSVIPEVASPRARCSRPLYSFGCHATRRGKPCVQLPSHFHVNEENSLSLLSCWYSAVTSQERAGPSYCPQTRTG